MNSERKIMHSQDKAISYIEKSFGNDFIPENLRVTEKRIWYAGVIGKELYSILIIVK